jgi:hypothetical protein
MEAEFLVDTLSNCNLLAISIGTPVRDSRYVLSSFDALRAPLPAALVDRGACGMLHRPAKKKGLWSAMSGVGHADEVLE